MRGGGAATRPAVTMGAVGLVFAAAYLGAAILFPKPDARLVVGDAVHHFVQLRSAVYDRDLQFQNEYVYLYGLDRIGQRIEGDEWIFDERTATGHVRNYMPVGPALAWAPLYLAFSALLWTGAWLTGAPAPTGYEPLLQLAPGLTGIAAATAAAILSAHVAARWVSSGWALAGTLAAWLGSSAVYYSLVSPSYSHAPSMFAVALLIRVWVDRAASPMTADRRWLFLTGWLSGLATLMRWQDAITLLLPLSVVVRHRAPLPARAGHAAVVLGGWLIAFLPQMVVWQVLYGTPLTQPQGADFMEWTQPNLLAVLFSANHGLFSWTPLLLAAIPGLWVIGRRDPPIGLPLAAFAVLTWWVNASVADWWAGEAFGARRFLSLFPLFAAGLALWLSRGGRWRIWLAAGCVGANLLLLLQYQLFMKGLTAIAPYPYEWFDLWLARFIVPIRLLAWWLS